MKKRKKLILFIGMIVLIFLIIGITFINENINKSLVKELEIEEGCYSTRTFNMFYKRIKHL